jgi:hypothetical protein
MIDASSVHIREEVGSQNSTLASTVAAGGVIKR